MKHAEMLFLSEYANYHNRIPMASAVTKPAKITSFKLKHMQKEMSYFIHD